MKINPNDFINPHTTSIEYEDEVKNVTTGGLTVLQYFSAMAMQGLCSNIVANKYDANLGGDNETCVEYAQIASDAVECAKALIEELNKESE